MAQTFDLCIRAGTYRFFSMLRGGRSTLWVKDANRRSDPGLTPLAAPENRLRTDQAPANSAVAAVAARLRATAHSPPCSAGPRIHDTNMDRRVIIGVVGATNPVPEPETDLAMAVRVPLCAFHDQNAMADRSSIGDRHALDRTAGSAGAPSWVAPASA
jgi:hypothetical protein